MVEFAIKFSKSIPKVHKKKVNHPVMSHVISHQ